MVVLQSVLFSLGKSFIAITLPLNAVSINTVKVMMCRPPAVSAIKVIGGIGPAAILSTPVPMPVGTSAVALEM